VVTLPAPVDLIAVRGLLDEALFRIHDADPALPREEAADGISRALAHVYSALASGGNFDRFRTEALAALEQAQRALSLLQPHASRSPPSTTLVSLVGQATQALIEIRYRTLPRGLPSPQQGHGTPSIRASVREPMLLEFVRPLIEPSVPCAANPQAPADDLDCTDMDGDAPGPELEPPSKRAPEAERSAARSSWPVAIDVAADERSPDVVPTEHQVLLRHARVAVEELGRLGVQRRAAPDEGWLSRSEQESRLLARLDAVLACGTWVLPHLVQILEERPLPDPELTWALLFVFGSVAGDDAWDQARRLLERTHLDDPPEMADAISDALALVPHPGAPATLMAWLGDRSRARRLIALRAASRRGMLDSSAAHAAARDPSASLAIAGAEALATSLGPIDPHALWAAMHRPNEPVVAAAMESAVVRRTDLGQRRALALVTEGRPEFAGAARLLAVTSGEDARGPLLEAATLSPGGVEALGWFGHLDAVEPLLALLQGEHRIPALMALQRITGASLTKERPTPEYQAGAAPFTQSSGPVPATEHLLADPEAWSAWWARWGRAARRETRFRWGHAWSPADDLAEMKAGAAPRRDRWLAYLELCARTGAASPFDPEAFVPRQEAQLAAWSTLLGSVQHEATGTWPVAALP